MTFLVLDLQSEVSKAGHPLDTIAHCEIDVYYHQIVRIYSSIEVLYLPISDYKLTF